MLASRWARLGAAILDAIPLMIVGVPLLILLGFVIDRASNIEQALVRDHSVALQGVMALGMFVVFVAINGLLIYRRQQTIGKMLLGIKVVRDDGSPLTGNRYLFVRYLPIYLIGQVPVIGGLFGLIDALLIFRSNKKCLHDDIAKTMVVRCR